MSSYSPNALGSEQAAVTLIRVPPHSDFEQGTGHSPRSHRNERDEPVELWAISRVSSGDDGTKIDDFWPASPDAIQRRD
jgi:hypothetical protein